MKFMPKHFDKDRMMLVDIMYVRPDKNENRKEDYLYVIYKDMETGEKFLHEITDPLMEVYIAKPEFRRYTHNKMFSDLNEVDKKTYKYKYLTYGLRQDVQVNDPYLSRLIEQHSKNIFKSPYIFGADYHPELWYRIQWLLEYRNDNPKPTSRMYLDIEVDGLFHTGIPTDGVAPISMCTLVDEDTKKVFVFMHDINKRTRELVEKYKDVDDEDAKEIEGLTFARSHKEENGTLKSLMLDIPGLRRQLTSEFEKDYPGFEYDIRFTIDEESMLIDLFNTINKYKRDFVLIWNIDYDIPYLIGRMEKLGMNPKEIMCHHDFNAKSLYYVKDKRNYDIKNRNNYLICTSYSKYLCQMQLYATTRKGQTESRSYKLGDIARKELGDDKLDFSTAGNIKTIAYTDPLQAIKYNIKDVLLQYGIENKVGDTRGLYNRAYYNCVSYDKVTKVLNVIDCRAYYEFYKQGYIVGNNPNIPYGDPDKQQILERAEKTVDNMIFGQLDEEEDDQKTKLSGAIVADPELNDAVGVWIMGNRSRHTHALVGDGDFTSLYPSEKRAFNISPHTLVGKLFIKDVYKRRKTKLIYSNLFSKNANMEYVNKIDFGKEYTEDCICGDVLSIGNKWLNLPSIECMDQMIRQTFNITEDYK